jgi:hypothetical protein
VQSSIREQRLPGLHPRMRDDSDRRAGPRLAPADCEVQILHIGGEMLFERERHDLSELRAALHGQHRLGEQCVGARYEHNDFAIASRGGSQIERTRRHIIASCTAAIHDDPLGGSAGGFGGG